MNKNKLISLFVTFGFLGKVKYFPGTIGSFGGLLAGASLIKILGHNIFISCFFILTLISFFAVEEYLKYSKSIDPQEVVIDEVLGQWIAIAFIPFNFKSSEEKSSLEINCLGTPSLSRSIEKSTNFTLAFEFVLSLIRSKLSPGNKYCSFD